MKKLFIGLLVLTSLSALAKSNDGYFNCRTYLNGNAFISGGSQYIPGYFNNSPEYYSQNDFDFGSNPAVQVLARIDGQQMMTLEVLVNNTSLSKKSTIAKMDQVVTLDAQIQDQSFSMKCSINKDVIDESDKAAH